MEFREATVLDTEEMTQWLITEHLASDQHLEHLKVLVAKRLKILLAKSKTKLVLSESSQYSERENRIRQQDLKEVVST